ncbi:hypothetical protein [Enterococcus plantarum]|uniref:hypothetical protein n=1 Tax=Enterococcus plantarum TaxID=1077675 RepID=UPI001A8C6D25|nr:hypothetical protein [Enterococcus plantarum]MBO0423380.1 hypothetical protein [Enterococcus plantarum]
MEVVNNLTKTQKDEIRKKVKEFMSTDGIKYEDWLFEKELDYLLNNLQNLQKMKQGGHN